MKVPDLIRRQQGTQKTLTRYSTKKLDYSKGITCVHMARFHLRNMGHKPPTIPAFKSALGARKAMKANGWNTVESMLDSMLEKINPAQMLLGDFAVVEGEGGIDSIMICGGLLRLFGWREDQPGLVVLEVEPDQLIGAWRV